METICGQLDFQLVTLLCFKDSKFFGCLFDPFCFVLHSSFFVVLFFYKCRTMQYGSDPMWCDAIWNARATFHGCSSVSLCGCLRTPNMSFPWNVVGKIILLVILRNLYFILKIFACDEVLPIFSLLSMLSIFFSFVPLLAFAAFVFVWCSMSSVHNFYDFEWCVRHSTQF